MDILLNIVIVIVALYLSMLGMYILYLAGMSLKKVRDELKEKGQDFVWQQKLFNYPVIALGVVGNFLFNVTAGSVLFIDIPRQWFFTARCQRHMKEDGYRGRLARSICKYFLNPPDNGDHC